jgi:hypothetical protein
LLDVVTDLETDKQLRNVTGTLTLERAQSSAESMPA